ncbi:hypothetical protein XAP412_530057 [Xanthomonas phaseoli pv. phaseoli]|uniref:Uncharacterized protein n=1 Tax=Xanthomonas campestris pv. phaseoli TaxID=317013 RepID=A0AB38E4X4_XANCH|nr:hypothetical protein XAP6984_580057 [Xanthomonas phaseoli pv. phaseoli]SON87448.1 hypothetical protein XAP412_530057 [Xanthomonas phaseoli pv. phaseoli]SON91246.1 hypothetical protein XAP7430_540058 [Xanthomonas phaseoli pv. phaseoli]SOO28569.1 hypothetical protein XAP6164_2510013 [Xanthomonas phaseoli pv. phaseoli]
MQACCLRARSGTPVTEASKVDIAGSSDAPDEAHLSMKGPLGLAMHEAQTICCIVALAHACSVNKIRHARAA